MNDINQKQNEIKSIELLKAQRTAYSQCKFCHILDLFSLILAGIAPIIVLIDKNLVDFLGAIGVIWTVIYLVAERYRRLKTEQGAKIQEQFDTELYGLPWNNNLCRTKIPIDIQQDLAAKYKNNDLSDWYSKEIGSQLPIEIAIILCQRINFSWELNLRKRFVTFLVIILILYYGSFIFICIYKNLGIYDVLLLLVPSLSFLIYSVQNSLSLQSHIKSKTETLNIIDNKLDEYKQNRLLPTYTDLRQIQDVIYIERTVPEKIPDWFYKWYKQQNENRTDQIIITIKNNF